MASFQASINCRVETVSCREGSMAERENQLSALTRSGAYELERGCELASGLLAEPSSTPPFLSANPTRIVWA